MTLDSKLSYASHIQKTKQKATIRIKTMYSLFKDRNLLLKTKLLLGKSYIRPILTSSTPLWMAATISNKKSLRRSKGQR